MIGDAYVVVFCDGNGCANGEEIPLLKMAQGYDEPDVDGELESLGWVIIGEHTHLCPDCVDETRKG
jgi:hypothetical protein